MSRAAWLDEIKRVLEHLGASDATEVELARGGFRLRIKRRPDARPAMALPPVADAREPPGAAVLAPLTGVFYRAATPGAPPYVAVGDAVQPDTVVGLIETMKIFNEVLAERRGVVRAILVESGQLVHLGDRLMILDDEDAGPEDEVQP